MMMMIMMMIDVERIVDFVPERERRRTVIIDVETIVDFVLERRRTVIIDVDTIVGFVPERGTRRSGKRTRSRRNRKAERRRSSTSSSCYKWRNTPGRRGTVAAARGTKGR